MFFCVVNATYKLKTKATRLSFERAGRETAGSYAERERESLANEAIRSRESKEGEVRAVTMCRVTV
jgi:hypothetical protein